MGIVGKRNRCKSIFKILHKGIKHSFKKKNKYLCFFLKKEYIDRLKMTTKRNHLK